MQLIAGITLKLSNNSLTNINRDIIFVFEFRLYMVGG